MAYPYGSCYVWFSPVGYGYPGDVMLKVSPSKTMTTWLHFSARLDSLESSEVSDNSSGFTLRGLIRSNGLDSLTANVSQFATLVWQLSF